LRLCCVGRGGESATPQPMRGMVCRETLRRGGNFLGCRGRQLRRFWKKFLRNHQHRRRVFFGVLFGR
jgi:hypothetical protein